MFNFIRGKARSKAPEVIRIPRKKFDAFMGGSMAAMRELPDLQKTACCSMTCDRIDGGQSSTLIHSWDRHGSFKCIVKRIRVSVASR